MFRTFARSSIHNGSVTFSAIATLFAFLFYFIVAGRPEWSSAYLGYSILYAISCAVTGIMGHLAIMNGSLAITSLILAYSLVLPTLYGLVVLKEQAGCFQYAGIALLLVPLYLVRGTDEGMFNKKKYADGLSM